MTDDGRVRRSFTVKVTVPDKPGFSQTDQFELGYSDTRPHEVRMYISDGRHWLFARDLLKDGARNDGVAGLMDVQVWNDGVNRLFMKLSSPDGEATLEFELGAVRQFLAETRRLVPYTREEMSMDLVIAKIFKEEAW